MTIKDFHELRVYQSAFEGAMKLFALSRTWPVEERYGLTSQIRRSSRSVCANIAEGWRKRRYPAAFASKLSDADAESGETGVWLEFALKCGYMTPLQVQPLLDQYNLICAQLVTMIQRANRWCGQG